MKRKELEYVSVGPYLVVHADRGGDVIDSFNVASIADAIEAFWRFSIIPHTRMIFDANGKLIAWENTDPPPAHEFMMTREAMRLTQVLPEARTLAMRMESMTETITGLEEPDE